MKTTTMTETIKVEDVKSVYSGKPRMCRCGCSGKYYYASAHVVEASKARGYEVTPDEVSDRMVRKIVKFINDHMPEVEVIDGTIFDVETGCNRMGETTRCYTAYVIA